MTLFFKNELKHQQLIILIAQIKCAVQTIRWQDRSRYMRVIFIKKWQDFGFICINVCYKYIYHLVNFLKQISLIQRKYSTKPAFIRRTYFLLMFRVSQAFQDWQVCLVFQEKMEPLDKRLVHLSAAYLLPSKHSYCSLCADIQTQKRECSWTRGKVAHFSVKIILSNIVF